MMLSAIADFLQLKGCGIVSQTIFEYEMPSVCKDGVLLLDNYYGTPRNHELPGYRASEFRVVVRGTEMLKGKALAKKVSDALEFQGETPFGAQYLVKQSLPENEPRVYKRSAGGYWEFEIDVLMWWVDA